MYDVFLFFMVSKVLGALVRPLGAAEILHFFISLLYFKYSSRGPRFGHFNFVDGGSGIAFYYSASEADALILYRPILCSTCIPLPTYGARVFGLFIYKANLLT